MMEFVHVTTEYSNAVLVAILPMLSSGVEQARLPVDTPLSPAHVRRFVCNIEKDDPGGYVTLTNGLELWFRRGIFSGFRTPRSFFNLQNPADIPGFYGTPEIDEAAALQLARQSILNSGHLLAEAWADIPPCVTPPPVIGTNMVPHYRFTWSDPVVGGTSATVEVNAARRSVEELWLSSPFLWRRAPTIPVTAHVISTGPPVTVQQSNSFLWGILPGIATCIETFRLDTSATDLAAQLQTVAFVQGLADVRIRLTNGFWFLTERGRVCGFAAPNSIFGRQPGDGVAPAASYLGAWQVDETNAVRLCRAALRSAGLNAADFNADQQPQILKTEPAGKYVAPAYHVRWITSLTNDPTCLVSEASFEVDGRNGNIRHFYAYDGHRVGREIAAEREAERGASSPTNTPASGQKKDVTAPNNPR